MKRMSRRFLALLMSLVLILGTQTSALAETMNQSEDESVVSEIVIDESMDEDSSLTDGDVLNEEENDITDSEIDSQESDVSEADVDENDESDSDETENEDELNEEDLSEDELSEEELSEGELSEEELSEDELSEEGTKEAEGEEELVDIEEDSMFPGAYLLNSLSAREKSDIEKLKSHAHDMDGLTPGVDYAENMISVGADSEEEALEIAEAYNGTLKSYSSFVHFAYIELNADDKYDKATVSDAVLMSLDDRNNLPAAWPMYYYHLCDESYEETYVEESSYGDLEQGEYVDFSEVEGASEGMASPEAYYNDPYIKVTNTNLEAPFQWQHAMVGSEYAWNQGITGNGVKVAVLDEGVDPNHEDIKCSEYLCSSSIEITVTRTNNGSTTSYGNHGTHVSGIIGATKNNSKGGCGVAPDASIISIAVFGYEYDSDFDEWYSNAPQDAIVNGIEMAVNKGVDIINMSLGGPQFSPDIEEAISLAKAAGIAVFVAAGNEATYSSAYPAGCKDAIAVAAVDSNNAVASFSNRGNQVRYSGPGVHIYSSISNGTSNYGYMDGTSQATPVIAGVAALILSSGKVTGSGAQKVDNLLAIMDSGAISNKCCSKGTVNVAKALGISYSTTAPGVPVPNVKPGTFYEESKFIQLSNPAGYNDCDIYYTLDGSKITFKDGVISPNAIKYTLSTNIKLEGKSTITVNAVAINKYTKIVSKQVSLKYVLKPNVKTITVLSDTGLKTGEPVVVPGGSVVLKATVAPDYAANKKVNWIVAAGPSGADLSKVKVSNGTVKPAKDAKTGQYTIRATAADNGGAYTDYKITVKTPDRQVSSIKLSATKGTVNVGATIYVPISDVVFADKSSAAKTGEDIRNFLGTPIYDSSLVTASINTEGKLVITGKKRGTAKITVVSHQNYGAIKKVVYTATVNQPVTGISLSKSSYDVVEGKTVTLGATVTPSDANNNKLVWSVDDSVKKIASVSGSGVFKATTAGIYNVYVASKENPDYKKTIKVKVLSKSDAITKLAFDSKSVDVFRVTNDTNCSTSKSVLLTITGSNTSYLDITSSNPDLVTVTSSDYTSSKKNVTVTATGKGTGKATITAISTDGGKVKATFTVNVVNPPTALTLAPPDGRSDTLCYNKSLKLTPVFETKYGAISANSKKLRWSSSNSYAISVDQNGNAKSKSYYNECVTITAETTDGSNLKATYTLYAVDCPSKIVGYQYGNYEDPKKGTYVDIVGDTGFIEYYWYQPHYASYYIYTPTISTSSPHIRAYWNNAGYVYFVADKAGTYTVTIKTTDGSGKSCKVNVVVYPSAEGLDYTLE